MTEVWDLPEVAEGIHRQREALEAALADGSQLMGWKLGFGSPAARARFGLSAPLVGFLLRENFSGPGAPIELAGARHPLAEPEIAVRIGRDLDGTEPSSVVADAISVGTSALEIVDINSGVSDLAGILGADIFQRGVVAAEFAPVDLTGLASARLEVCIDGASVAATDAPLAAVGDPVLLVGHTARWLLTAGLALHEGDVVLLGSTTAPIPLSPGRSLTFAYSGLPTLSVSFR